MWGRKTKGSYITKIASCLRDGTNPANVLDDRHWLFVSIPWDTQSFALISRAH